MLGAESADRQTGGVDGEWCSLKLHRYQLFRDVWQFIGGCLVAIILSAADFNGSVSGGSIRLRLRREDRFAIFPAAAQRDKDMRAV
jgi:hypothetical protein